MWDKKPLPPPACSGLAPPLCGEGEAMVGNTKHYKESLPSMTSIKGRLFIVYLCNHYLPLAKRRGRGWGRG